MITSTDSSVILDVLTDDPDFGRDSEEALRRAAGEGQLVICECVLAEIYPALGSSENCDAFLGDWQIDFVPSSSESARLAGSTFAHYLSRARSQRRIIADFLIAAHAQVHADRLLTRDRGFARDYFKSLHVLDPSR